GLRRRAHRCARLGRGPAGARHPARPRRPGAAHRHHGHPRPARRVLLRPRAVSRRRSGHRRAQRAHRRGGRRPAAPAGAPLVSALAWQTVRARTGSFVGSFVALALGVALLTASALSALSALGTGDGRAAWLARADVVAAGAASATLTADDATGPPGVTD